MLNILPQICGNVSAFWNFLCCPFFWGNVSEFFFTVSREMKLVPFIMDYCLLWFEALKFLLRVRLHGRSQPKFYFFNVSPQIFQRNHKVHLSNSLETNFYNISSISFRVIRHRNHSYCSNLRGKTFLLVPHIIPTFNNSQTNDRNVKICFQVIWEVNITISLKNLRAYIKKIKVR